MILLTSLCKSREKRKRESGKVPGFEKRDQKLWKLRNVEIVPVMIGALGSISAELDSLIGKLGIRCNAGVMQKSALLETARILLRKVLEM